MLCFVVKAKVLCLGFQKRTQLETVFKLYLQHCSRTVQCKYSSVRSVFYRGLFPEPGRVACQLCPKAVSIKLDNSNLARTVCTFSYLKNVPLMIQMNQSFEQCRVVRIVCRFSDHKYRHV